MKKFLIGFITGIIVTTLMGWSWFYGKQGQLGQFAVKWIDMMGTPAVALFDENELQLITIEAKGDGDSLLIYIDESTLVSGLHVTYEKGTIQSLVRFNYSDSDVNESIIDEDGDGVPEVRYIQNKITKVRLKQTVSIEVRSEKVMDPNR